MGFWRPLSIIVPIRISLWIDRRPQLQSNYIILPISVSLCVSVCVCTPCVPNDPRAIIIMIHNHIVIILTYFVRGVCIQLRNPFWVYTLAGVTSSRMGDHPGTLVKIDQSLSHIHTRVKKPTVPSPTVPQANDSCRSMNQKKISIFTVLFHNYTYK